MHLYQTNLHGDVVMDAPRAEHQHHKMERGTGHRSRDRLLSMRQTMGDDNTDAPQARAAPGLPGERIGQLLLPSPPEGRAVLGKIVRQLQTTRRQRDEDSLTTSMSARPTHDSSSVVAFTRVWQPPAQSRRWHQASTCPPVTVLSVP